MKKLFQRKKAPNPELNQTEAQLLEEWENAMDKVIQTANELSEAIRETPFELTLTVTRTDVWITKKRRAGDPYLSQEDRKEK